jgi:predicted RNA-binding protein (TIGR00451 family)
LEIVFSSKCLFEVAKLNTPSCPLDGRADVDVFVYFIDKEPIFFDYSNRIFPTVYCAWKCPSIVPTVTTWPPVLPKLIGGADLMLPGVVGPEQGGADFSILRKGQICAVNVVGNRAAVSIGVSLLSGGEMIAGRMKGKGIVILHTHKDLLWEAGSKLEPPFLAFSEPKEHPKSISQSEQGSRQPQMLLSVEKLDLKLKSKLDLDSGESDTVVGDEITTHGEMTAGEMTPGETTAGETTAGETTPGETTPLETTPGGNGSELLDQMPPNADGQDTNVPMAMSDIGPPLSQGIVALQ